MNTEQAFAMFTALFYDSVDLLLFRSLTLITTLWRVYIMFLLYRRKLSRRKVMQLTCGPQLVCDGTWTFVQGKGFGVPAQSSSWCCPTLSMSPIALPHPKPHPDIKQPQQFCSVSSSKPRVLSNCGTLLSLFSQSVEASQPWQVNRIGSGSCLSCSLASPCTVGHIPLLSTRVFSGVMHIRS